MLGVYERQILLMIYGPVHASDDFHRRTNKELYYVLNDMSFYIQRLRWLAKFFIRELVDIDEVDDHT